MDETVNSTQFPGLMTVSSPGLSILDEGIVPRDRENLITMVGEAFPSSECTEKQAADRTFIIFFYVRPAPWH